jgi:hypothetical protein
MTNGCHPQRQSSEVELVKKELQKVSQLDSIKVTNGGSKPSESEAVRPDLESRHLSFDGTGVRIATPRT